MPLPHSRTFLAFPFRFTGRRPRRPGGSSGVLRRRRCGGTSRPGASGSGVSRPGPVPRPGCPGARPGAAERPRGFPAPDFPGPGGRGPRGPGIGDCGEE
ncbi:hypothetical protein GCM10010293_60240 [Streptomyces griseoflavus]|nr:hypothetical protein GCM10010293_60240 [Streptomyces griseoflavus]